MENVVFFEKTVKLAMKGTRSRGQAAEEEDEYEGQKQ